MVVLVSTNSNIGVLNSSYSIGVVTFYSKFNKVVSGSPSKTIPLFIFQSKNASSISYS